MSTSTADHRRAAADRRARCAVLTVSDTRTPDTDAGGKLIRQLLTDAGHDVIDHTIVKDDPRQIEQQLAAWLPNQESSITNQKSPQVILTTGGTGIAPRDTTVEIVKRLLDKELEGFGELFRMLSYQEVGPAAMLSRAVAGLSAPGSQGNGTFIFTLPGSPNAVRLAMEKPILPELPHLLWERSK